jgi:DNA-binding SARP family transcriptional activator/tetratricopeptide (TPR) repeat protein
VPLAPAGAPARRDEVQFFLLGPVRVRRGDVELDPGPKQQRLILAMLLARAGTWVSTSELVELLWGDDPPNSAANTVHRYVGVLRRMIEPDLPRRANGRWLLGEPGRYRVDVRAVGLDLLSFRTEIERSRSDAAAGHRKEALGRVVAALESWRDRCAADLAETLADHPVFVALEEECTQAVRFAARLALTEEPAAAVPAVRRSTDRHPLDEGLHGLLMSLLAADGRTVEAIRIFQDISRRLADRLGVEPGAGLEAVLRDVLRVADHPGGDGTAGVIGEGDPVVVAPGARPGPAIRPAQLPADHASFAGRRRELQTLVAHARNTSHSLPIIAIDGIPGVGKTTLAVHLAHRLSGDYADGNLYINLRGFDGRRAPVEPAEALQALLVSLGVVVPGGSADVEAMAALYRSTLADRRILVLLDNADDAEQVRPLLPGNPDCLVIVTSRSRLPTLGVTAGACLLTLDIPTAEEARDAIRASLRWDGPDDAEAAALSEIIERCGRLPVALSLLAARMYDTPVRVILADLRAKRSGLDVFSDVNLDNDLRAVFAGSYDRLPPEAARLFRMLSVHPGPDITEEAMAGLMGVGESVVRPLLRDLMRARLLTQARPRRYQMHVLVMIYAAELAAAHEAPGEIQAARSRLYDFYQSAVEHARDVIHYPRHDGEHERSGEAWFVAEHDVLRAVIEDAAGHGEARRVWRLTLVMQVFYQSYVWWREWQRAARFALDVATAAGDVEGQAQMRRSLAGAHFFLEENEVALVHLDAAQKLFEQAGMSAERARVMMNQCRVLMDDAGGQSRAIRLYREVAVLLRRHGMHRELAGALQVMATGFQHRRPRLAIMLTQRSLAICAAVKDERGVAFCEDILAQAALAEGRLDDALAHHRRGIIHLRPDNRQGYAEGLTTLGDILERQGRLGEARDAWLEALTYSDEVELRSTRPALERLRRLGDVLAPEADDHRQEPSPAGPPDHGPAELTRSVRTPARPDDQAGRRPAVGAEHR